ncbi:hypothetical protein [Microlunatus antarcticus]|uniref:Vitamin K-dependent gamma-carboxylase n=1 Tax=Microlunatus antarcticus TaxID=53388 RepID=A0A7W5P7Z9_9ACTN|nr:hypothetical protein [Microlunatus antarcticus]MBB3327952.1 hypothetical protein [Microlunatus antarcticus]
MSTPRPGSVAGWFAPVLPEARVAVLRRVLYVFVLLDMHLIVRDPIPLSHHPDLYRPLIFAEVLHLPPPSLPLAWGLYAVLVAGCVAGLTGRAPRSTGWVVAAAFTWWVAIGFSYGKVDHDHLALVVALWVLPTVGAVPGGWSSGRRSAQAGWALKVVQIAVIGTYFLSALTKISNDPRGWSLTGWPESYILLWAVVRRPHGLGQLLIPYPGVLHVMQWFSILAELGSVVVLWLRGRALLCAALFWMGFHVFTVAMLYIHFAPTVVCWLAFAPLERLAPWWRARHPPLEPPVPIPARAESASR